VTLEGRFTSCHPEPDDWDRLIPEPPPPQATLMAIARIANGTAAGFMEDMGKNLR
jgi:hypothetical protein